MERFTALIGFFGILAIAWAMSTNRSAIKWRPVIWGLILQIIVAVFVLKGQLIADALTPLQLPLTRTGAALVFILGAIVTGLLLKRVFPLPAVPYGTPTRPAGGRLAVWIAFGI